MSFSECMGRRATGLGSVARWSLVWDAAASRVQVSFPRPSLPRTDASSPERRERCCAGGLFSAGMRAWMASLAESIGPGVLVSRPGTSLHHAMAPHQDNLSP